MEESWFGCEEGESLCIMECYGVLWSVMGYYGVLWGIMGYLWSILGYYGVPTGDPLRLLRAAWILK